MKSRLAIVFIILTAGAVALWLSRSPSTPKTQIEPPAQSEPATQSPAPETAPQAREHVPPVSVATAPPAIQPGRGAARITTPAPVTNKLERLAQVREQFRSLAAGDATVAMRAAKDISDGTERETALLALVTEWTRGELRSPQERAQAIADYGLEAGLGIELAKNPQLALLWATELTDPAGKVAVLSATASAMVASDPAAAFALASHIDEGNRRKFIDSIFAGWASQDTDAALEWANQAADPAERESDLAAIRSAAPVGIGAQLMVKDGLPVINQLIPGTASELSGMLRPGDRILALAQADGPFVQTRDVPLQDIVQWIRGAPGTVLQLQVIHADASPDSAPQTVPIVRTQIKFKK